MARSTARSTPVLPRVLLALAAACALRWCLQGRAFVGAAAPPAAAARGRVAMAGVAQDGLFTPAVWLVKEVMGDAELKKMRGQIIKAHGAVMADFIDTAETRFGQWTLKTLFDAADKDGNGELDKDELAAGLQRLGFRWMAGSKVDQLVKKGDQDGNGMIDFEEFKRMAPTMLKQNLLKLAKQNGGELGMLS